MRHSIYRHLVELALCSVWLLSACGGGGRSDPAPSMYSIGGTLSGLASGGSLVLQDNDGANSTVSANGAFKFSTQVANGTAYAVTVLTQATAQSCTVTSGSGTVSGASVTSIRVACGPATESVIHAFGATPAALARGPMIQGSDGNVYGTTASEGMSGSGTVFKITSAGVYTVLYSFAGGTADGNDPTALIQGSDGDLYGTTGAGGTSNNGTVFKITPAGVETVLYSFAGGTDGALPTILINGSDGNFYGTTVAGGASNRGTVFKITSAGLETVLHSFGSYADGLGPTSLIQGSDGNFYGTMAAGGAGAFCSTVGCGTVLKITPAGVETVLYSFNGSTDGASPTALVQGKDGDFYGTTGVGGTSSKGTVFKITPAGVETVLHTFAGLTDGAAPSGLIQGSDGNFYGISLQGGEGTSCLIVNCGTVFLITPAGAETLFYSFPGGTAGGAIPTTLIQGSDGNFYGRTVAGGTNNGGTVFQITAAGAETVLYSFAAGTTDGDGPGTLIQGSDGNFYGTTGGGTAGIGTVFKVTPAGAETVLYSFAVGNTDGAYPTVLIQGSDGNFYGITSQGGPSSNGTVFKVTPAGAETVLHSFAGGTTDGADPTALIQGSDGNFYGTTVAGGASNVGTVFKVTPTGAETVIYSFAGGTIDGAYPHALIQSADGNFYGTTDGGGTSNNGTVLKVNPAGVETVLYSFGFGPDGASPRALIQGSDGDFYGITLDGGTNNSGTVFKVAAAGVETVLYSFVGAPTDGSNPSALIQGSDGTFYGTTNEGGLYGEGTMFKF